LRDVVRDSDSEWAREGQYHWVLEDVTGLSVPVPCIGRQMMFKLPLDVESAVVAALAPCDGQRYA
jgi:hypothetical protein